ncbi:MULTISPECIES: ATP-dependent DNA ligase [Pseudonocardia]|uniref:Probable DNA ligase n=2 Tax=Pseudonocardia TaxID=1847 RepID=A0A1Y2N4E3_PSEAH|nr:MULTISPECIES: ATP-dependent DNA ligase [Pseudonocardia]OSY42363.1 putative DNA ligase-like protein [Pseudonocardia autotrophica]TDN75883.1 DNA ligase-1 [Pseudonocardia autotrophica]BBF99855.1 DNA ligase [Pseudonocardia autotrophica]GEC28382.1 DNA ligase [Pseudonocardia saturnea]
MLLSDVVTTSAAVGATRARREKTTALADLLRAAGPTEIVPVVAWLSGTPRQGRIGTGWRTLAAVDVPPADTPSWTVQQVDELLDELAGTSGQGSARRRRELLDRLYGTATADEQRFLHRLLTGELRQGALEGLMVDAVAAASGAGQAAVRRAFMLSGRLPETAATALAGGAEALAGIGLRVGRPIRPMLASPGDSLDAALAALGTEVTVEHKLDGARIQVHRTGDEIRVWTRTLREITAAVPEIVELTRALPCSAAVLDGETLALDDDGRPRAFQDTMSRFGTEADGDGDGGRDERGVLLSPFFFDLLHLDGHDLVDEPLETRLDLLAGLLEGDRQAPLRMPGVRRPSPEEAAAVLDGALDAGQEGVVVKDLAAPYAAGRRGKAWQKVKPVHTLDLVVLGAEWGYGRRTGSLSNIHLGARDPDGGEPVMVGKTFKGMTDELLAWQTETFPRYAREEEPGVLFLRPELVVEIALDGAQRSTRYPGGVALRFARVLRYRPDRTAADADSLDAVRALLSG